MIFTYVFIGVIVFSLVIEALTSDMVSIWFTGGGIVALILSVCGVVWYISVPVFIAVSLGLLLLFRKAALKKFSLKDGKTNAQAVIGKEFELLSPIGFNKAGSIKVNGVVWSVVTENEHDEVKEGTIVKVINIKGNKYIVEVI